jgi:hypothetical protein
MWSINEHNPDGIGIVLTTRPVELDAVEKSVWRLD